MLVALAFWSFESVFIFYMVLMVTCTIPALRVSVARSYDVPMFGPAIPFDGTFEKNESFRQFLLAKCKYLQQFTMFIKVFCKPFCIC